MHVSDLIQTWLKEKKLANHYDVNNGMIECLYYHSRGVNRIRIIADGVYYWKITGGEFHKMIINIADPDFFEKLEMVLQSHCGDPKRKTFRQL